MTYASYLQVMRDIDYMREFAMSTRHTYSPFYEHEENVTYTDLRKVGNIWLERIKEKYELSRKNNSALGRFLTRFPLKFKEFRCLLDLIEGNTQGYFDSESEISEDGSDVFRKHRVRYESSQLRRFKLVYKIVNPLKPMKTVYEVSYKAQLALKNKRYTDEYQQLDMALEEESKRNSPEELDSLYYVINPRTSLDDLVASDTLKDSLKTALARELERNKIFKKWGFAKVIEYGAGTTLNFRGAPGTGKTLAANCFAKELGRKLLMVRYDQLQSCWVGGTEKHIQRAFKIAKAKNAVLFFDEADAIALNRNTLGRSWEMSQVNTLLKELERFEGVCIFATNFAEKYDPAFERRLTMHIDFNMPNNEQRLEILDKALPKKSRDKKLSFKDLDLANLSGGDIKNIALNAAGIAAKENAAKINRKHIEDAIKLGGAAKKLGESNPTRYIS